MLGILRKYGFDPKQDQMQADHVHEIQLGGPDAVGNLWPLQEGINRSAGPTIAGCKVRYPDGSGEVALRDLKRLAGTDFYFVIDRLV